jgi:hypothetical protein
VDIIETTVQGIEVDNPDLSLGGATHLDRRQVMNQL